MLELEKLAKKGNWWATMRATARYNNIFTSEAESFWDADQELTDHPIPREPPALLADSEPQVELPAVEPPAVDLEQRTEMTRCSCSSAAVSRR